MTRHLGASIFLSVAVVIFFAVILYTPDGPPARPVLARPGPASATAERAPESEVPDLTPGVPLSEASARVEPAPVVSAVRRGAFTEVRAGETLADVAVRVYGSADAAGLLWSANRDHLTRPDGPIEAGMLLRTP